MEQFQKYLLHCTGIYAFLSWMEHQSNQGLPCTISGQTISSHPFISKYFSLGIAKNKKLSQKPFIAIQPNEAEWFKLIQWDKICIRKKDSNIYFISQLVSGDGEEYPDIPPFAFALSFDTIEKTSILFQIQDLQGREYSKIDGEIYINYHKSLFNLKVHQLEKNEPYLITNSKQGFSYIDIIRKKEAELRNKFGDSLIEIQGDVNYSAESEELLKKFNKEKEISSGFLNKYFRKDK